MRAEGLSRVVRVLRAETTPETLERKHSRTSVIFGRKHSPSTLGTGATSSDRAHEHSRSAPTSSRGARRAKSKVNSPLFDKADRRFTLFNQGHCHHGRSSGVPRPRVRSASPRAHSGTSSLAADPTRCTSCTCSSTRRSHRPSRPMCFVRLGFAVMPRASQGSLKSRKRGRPEPAHKSADDVPSEQTKRDRSLVAR